MAAFFSYLHSTCIKFSKFIISALTFYLQADFEHKKTHPESFPNALCKKWDMTYYSLILCRIISFMITQITTTARNNIRL